MLAAVQPRQYGLPSVTVVADGESTDQSIIPVLLFAELFDLGAKVIFGPPDLVFISTLLATRAASLTGEPAVALRRLV